MISCSKNHIRASFATAAAAPAPPIYVGLIPCRGKLKEEKTIEYFNGGEKAPKPNTTVVMQWGFPAYTVGTYFKELLRVGYCAHFSWNASSPDPFPPEHIRRPSSLKRWTAPQFLPLPLGGVCPGPRCRHGYSISGGRSGSWGSQHRHYTTELGRPGMAGAGKMCCSRNSVLICQLLQNLTHLHASEVCKRDVHHLRGSVVVADPPRGSLRLNFIISVILLCIMIKEIL